MPKTILKRVFGLCSAPAKISQSKIYASSFFRKKSPLQSLFFLKTEGLFYPFIPLLRQGFGTLDYVSTSGTHRIRFQVLQATINEENSFSYPSFNKALQLPGFWFASPSDNLFRAYNLRCMHRRFLGELIIFVKELLGKDFQRADIEKLLSSYENLPQIERKIVVLEQSLMEFYAKEFETLADVYDFDTVNNYDGTRLEQACDLIPRLVYSGVYEEDASFFKGPLPALMTDFIQNLAINNEMPYPLNKFPEMAQLTETSLEIPEGATARYKKIIDNQGEKINELEAMFFLYLCKNFEFLVVKNWTVDKIETTLSEDLAVDLAYFHPEILLNIPSQYSKMCENYDKKKNLLICLYQLLRHGFFLTGGFK